MLINLKKIKFLESLLSFLTSATIFLAPLVFSRSFVSPFSTTKMLLVYLGSALILPILVALNVSDKRYRFSRSDYKTFLPLGIFLLVLIVSALLGASPSHSFWSSFGRGTGVFFMLATTVIAYSTYLLTKLRGKAFLAKLLTVMATSGVIVSISTYQWVVNIVSGNSTILQSMSEGGGVIGNSSLTAPFLIFTLISALTLFFICQNRTRKSLSLLALLAILISPDFFTASFSSALSFIGQARGAVLGILFGVGIGLCVYFSRSSKKALHYLGYWGIAIGIVIVLVGGYLLVKPDSQIHKSFVNQTGDMRFIYWDISVKGIKDHPLLGSGPENYQYVFQKYFNPKLWSTENARETFTDRPHNVFLEVATNEGLLGLLSYLFLLFSIYSYIIILMKLGTITRVVGAVFIGGISAYILQNQFVFDSVSSYLCLLVLFGLLAGLINSNENKVEDIKDVTLNSKQITVISGSIVLAIFILVTFVFIPARKALAIVSLLKLDIAQGINSYPKWPALGNTDEISIAAKAITDQYAISRPQILADNNLKLKSIDDLKLLNSFIMGFSDKSPIDYRLAFSAANITSLIKTFDNSYSNEDIQRGLLYANRAAKLSPANLEVYWTTASLDFYLGDVKGAEEALNRSIQLNPSVPESYLLLLKIAANSNNESLFQATARQAVSSIPGFEAKYLKRSDH